MILYYQHFGSNNIAIGISGQEQSVLEQYYSLYNHGATNGEIHWLNEPTFGYIWTDEERLSKYLINSSLFLLLNQNSAKYKKKTAGCLKEAKELAEQRFKGMIQEDFLNTEKENDIHIYSMGEIEHDVPEFLITRREEKLDPK